MAREYLTHFTQSSERHHFYADAARLGFNISDGAHEGHLKDCHGQPFICAGACVVKMLLPTIFVSGHT